MDLHYGYYRWRVRRLFIDPYLLEQEEGAQLASVVLVIEPGDEKRFCGSGKAWFQFDPNSPADTFAWATPGARNRVGEDVFEVTKLAVIEGGAVAKFVAHLRGVVARHLGMICIDCFPSMGSGQAVPRND